MRSAFRDHLLQLEDSLWRPETRFDVDHMDAVLHPGFFEFGRSGRSYSRQESLVATATPLRASLRNFVLHPITDDVMLVTYVSIRRRR